MTLLFGWIVYAIYKRIRRAIVDTPTDKQIQDEGATNVIPECLLIPEDEKGMEDATELEYCVDELMDVDVPFEDTISQSEPVPPSRSEETSSAVTPNTEPNDIPKLAQDKDEPSLRVPPTDLIATHSSNAAKSFQKLLQFAMSQQGPSETDVSATSTQVESAAASSPVLEQTDQTTGSVARNQQRSKGKSKKKKNKRNKGHNAKN